MSESDADLPPPIVTTKYGVISGAHCAIPSCSSSVDIFLGIPFAQPPVGRLRLKKPLEPERWKGVLETREFGTPAVHTFTCQGEPQYGNCLTLNVFRPHNTNNEHLLPVLVYVHGGGFSHGSSSAYGYDALCRNFVVPEANVQRPPLLFVTVQYRLGLDGFLTDGSAELPGNLGLWDQAMAIRFLRENLAAFGGDPTRIVVWGLSAGGASCAALALSPFSCDALAGSVEMSGTLLPSWSCSEQCVCIGRKLLDELYGGTFAEQSSAKIERIFDGRNEAEMDRIVEKERLFRTSFNILKLHPRIDGEFLPRDVPELVVDSTSRRPCLMGLTADEGLYFTLMKTEIDTITITKPELTSFDESQFRKRICDYLRSSDGFPDDEVDRAAARICEFYLHLDEDGAKSTQFCVRKYSQLFSDMMFVVPAIWMARLRAAHRISTYIYYNEYFNPKQFANHPYLEPYQASTHANEYPYVNGIFPVGEFEFTAADRYHQKLLLQMLTSFVTEGRPRIDGVENWPTVESDQPIRFVLFDRMSSEPSVTAIPELEERAAFWHNFRETFSFDLIRNRVWG